MGLTFGFPDERCKRLQRKFWYPIIKRYISIWTHSSTFSCIPHEETVEVAINKDTKVRNGLVGKISGMMPQTNGYGLRLTKLFTSTAARLCVDYNRQVPPCSHKDDGAVRIQRDGQGGVIGTVSHLVNRFVHHEMITHLASRKYVRPEMRMEPGTKVERLTFSISCEVWQRISVCHRVQHMWRMPFVSSMVSLSQPYPPFSIKVTVHGTREEHTGNAWEYTMKPGSQHVPFRYKWALRSGSYKAELGFFLGKLEERHERGLHWTSNTAQYTWFWTTYPAPRSVQCVVQPDLEYSHEETDTQILLETHAIHVQSTEIQPIALHQFDIYIMLSGSSSMFWPPRYRMHLFSGCDSTSRFLGRGKKTARNISEKALHFIGNPWRLVYYVWYNVSWLEKYRYSKTTHNSATLMRCESTHGIM